MENMLSLFLDIGGTDIKGAMETKRFDQALRVVRLPIPIMVSPSEGEREYNPQQILETCRRVMKLCGWEEGVAADIYLSGQMGCWILTDQDNVPVTNVISWQDQRFTFFDQPSKEIKFDSFVPTDWIHKNGREFRSSLAPLGLYTFLTKNSVNKRLRLHSLLSWISASLDDSKSHQIHITDAASLGMVDLKEGQWMEFGGPLASLDFPRIFETSNSEEECLPGKILVRNAIGDQQGSLLGAGLDRNSIVINIGTGGQIAYLGSDGDNWPYQRRPYFGGAFINTKTHLPAGRSLAAFTKKLTLGDTTENYDWMNRCALEVEPAYDIDLYNFENFLMENSPERGDRVMASSVVHSLINSYVNVLKESGLSGNGKTLIFAGGVGQKMTVIADTLAQKTKFNYTISRAVETTIAGLRKLSQKQD